MGYFENWCQDESRHGDFFAAILKTQPYLLNDFWAKLWAKFFCLSVYITMYLNDQQRTEFYESLGLETTRFNQHVIIETNNTTKRVFPEVPDVDNENFWRHMDDLVVLNKQLNDIHTSTSPNFLKFFKKLPIYIGFSIKLAEIWNMPAIDSGSFDMASDKTELSY